MAQAIQTFYRPCMICESSCGLAVTVAHGRVLSIEGDRADPFSQGHLCPKAWVAKDLHEDPDRLREPMLKTAEGWKPVSWNKALNLAGRKLNKIRKQDGKNAVALYYGNPNAFSLGFCLSFLDFAKALDTDNQYASTSVDQLPNMVAAHLMFGHQAVLPVPDLDRTDYFLVLGSNVLVSKGSMMSLGNAPGRLAAIKKRGGKIVTVDPRRHQTAKLADQHLFIRPGTDALLLLAMMQVIFSENLTALGKMGNHVKGLEELEKAASAYPPERVAAATGIDAKTIAALAREFAAAPSAACFGRMGTCAQLFGGVVNWLIYALNIITGNLDRPGGLLFANPAVDLVDIAAKMGQKGHLNEYQSRVRGLPEFGGELPAVALYDEILTPGKGRVRGLVTIAANIALSSPNSARVEKALKKLDFYVAVDYYINETTRHANLILPPVSHLEREVFHVATQALAVRNTVKYGPPVFEPPKNGRNDNEILDALADRLDPSPVSQIRRALTTPNLALEFLLRIGPYGAGWKLWKRGLTLKKVKAMVHGIDLGPLEPCLPDRLYTPDKKIRLAPAPYLKDLPRLEEHFFGNPPEVEGYDLQLTGRRTLTSMNWWLHNYPRMTKGKDRCTALMNPADAKARGIREGGSVHLASPFGEITVPVDITENIMPGVVSVPHGWGHNKMGARLQNAQKKPGACINDLTDHKAVDAMCGMAALNGQWVKAEAAD